MFAARSVTSAAPPLPACAVPEPSEASCVDMFACGVMLLVSMVRSPHVEAGDFT